MPGSSRLPSAAAAAEAPGFHGSLPLAFGRLWDPRKQRPKAPTPSGESQAALLSCDSRSVRHSTSFCKVFRCIRLFNLYKSNASHRTGAPASGWPDDASSQNSETEDDLPHSLQACGSDSGGPSSVPSQLENNLQTAEVRRGSTVCGTPRTLKGTAPAPSTRWRTRHNDVTGSQCRLCCAPRHYMNISLSLSLSRSLSRSLSLSLSHIPHMHTGKCR